MARRSPRVRWVESASGWVPQNKWFWRTMNYLVWKMSHGDGWKLILVRFVRAYFEGSFQLTSEKVFWHQTASRVIVGSEVTYNFAMLTIWTFPEKRGQPSWTIENILIASIHSTKHLSIQYTTTRLHMWWFCGGKHPTWTEHSHPIDSSQACSKSWYFEKI